MNARYLRPHALIFAASLVQSHDSSLDPWDFRRASRSRTFGYNECFVNRPAETSAYKCINPSEP
jgi:hypothetical protein